jgi:transposase
MTYSLDFRKKVFVTKAKKGLTFEQTSERFDIPIRTLFRWHQRLEPCTKRNKLATKIDMVALENDIKARPDSYQWERAQQFNVTPAAISLALKRLNISYKKNAAASQSESRNSSAL